MIRCVSFTSRFIYSAIASIVHWGSHFVRWLRHPLGVPQRVDLVAKTEFDKIIELFGEEHPEQHVYINLAFGNRLDQKWPRFILEAAEKSTVRSIQFEIVDTCNKQQETKLLSSRKIAINSFLQKGYPPGGDYSDIISAHLGAYVERSLKQGKNVYIANWADAGVNSKIQEIYNTMQLKYPKNIHLIVGCGPHNAVIKGQCSNYGRDVYQYACSHNLQKKPRIPGESGMYLPECIKELNDKLGHAYAVFQTPDAIVIPF